MQQDNQWWDQCIWVKGAWKHYAVTGYHAFLEAAYSVTLDGANLPTPIVLSNLTGMHLVQIELDDSH